MLSVAGSESPQAEMRGQSLLVTNGAGSRTKGLLMAYRLLDMARVRWATARRRAPAVAGSRWGRFRGDGVPQANKRSKPRSRAA
jgi:hypothetical protein